MARTARIVVPGLPHHVTQRGNRREPIFFEPGDELTYLRMLAEQTSAAGVEIWAYCLMPNHVHLILTPSDEAGLAKAVGETHRQYTSFVNGRAGWTGHLFQSRFASAAMDEGHLRNAVLYVSLNPVRAGLCRRAADWPWSSVGAHLAGTDGAFVRAGPVLDRFGPFGPMLAEAEGNTRALEDAFDALRSAERTGRPVGGTEFIATLEAQLGRSLVARKGGPVTMR